MTEFIDTVDGVGQTRYTVEQAMLVLSTIEAAFESAKTGQRMDLNSSLANAYRVEKENLEISA